MAGSSKRYSTEQVIEALRATKGMANIAARHLGCHPDTVHNYCKRYPSVAAEKKHQEAELVDTATLQLWSAVQRGDLSAVFFVLKTLGRDRGFAERTEVTGKDGGPIEHAHIHLWEERLQAVHNAMAEKKAAIQLDKQTGGGYGQPEETA